MKTAAPAADRLRRVRPWIALLALSTCGACASVGAKGHNLGELHDEEGRHRREGVLMGDLEHEVRSALTALFAGTRLGMQSKPPGVIKDPLARCLENLVELEAMSPDDPAVRSLQVEHFSRLAVEDPWELSREACVRGLGRLGLLLELARHPRAAPAGDPAGPEQVGPALGALTAAWLPFTRGGELDEVAAQAAVDQVLALELDVQAGLRILRAVRPLVRGVRWDPRALPLVDLETHVQRRQVHAALLAAWRDQPPRPMSGSNPGWPSSRVRAAAVRALVLVHGEAALAEYLRNFDQVLDPDLMVALLQLVERFGLPQALAGVPPEAMRQMRETWIDGIFFMAHGHADGQVRVSAMLALGKISGGELSSLREEDWHAWLQARRLGPIEQEGEAPGEATQVQGS